MISVSLFKVLVCCLCVACVDGWFVYNVLTHAYCSDAILNLKRIAMHPNQ